MAAITLFAVDVAARDPRSGAADGRAAMTSPFELGTDGPTRILVGVDGSDTSMGAAAYAVGLACRQGSLLIALYVGRLSGLTASMAATAAAALDATDSVAAELKQALDEGCERLGMQATFVYRRGNPYLEVVRVADAMRVDAVVVGGSMRAGHRLVGSLAAHLVRDARWPVTVVP
jgi:nucleotide-binding universal stress UspA family protein